VAFGEITKQLAQQALGNTIKEALDPEVPKTTPAQPETAGATIVAQVQAMQRALKPDEELAVFCAAGGETVRVLEFYAPSWQVLVLTGMDGARNMTRIISAAEALQLTCKVVKAGAKPIRIGFITPKVKSE